MEEKTISASEMNFYEGDVLSPIKDFCHHSEVDGLTQFKVSDILTVESCEKDKVIARDSNQRIVYIYPQDFKNFEVFEVGTKVDCFDKCSNGSSQWISGTVESTLPLTVKFTGEWFARKRDQFGTMRRTKGRLNVGETVEFANWRNKWGRGLVMELYPYVCIVDTSGNKYYPALEQVRKINNASEQMKSSSSPPPESTKKLSGFTDEAVKEIYFRLQKNKQAKNKESIESLGKMIPTFVKGDLIRISDVFEAINQSSGEKIVLLPQDVMTITAVYPDRVVAESPKINSECPCIIFRNNYEYVKILHQVIKNNITPEIDTARHENHLIGTGQLLKTIGATICCVAYWFPYFAFKELMSGFCDIVPLYDRKIKYFTHNEREMIGEFREIAHPCKEGCAGSISQYFITLIIWQLWPCACCGLCFDSYTWDNNYNIIYNYHDIAFANGIIRYNGEYPYTIISPWGSIDCIVGDCINWIFVWSGFVMMLIGCIWS